MNSYLVEKSPWMPIEIFSSAKNLYLQWRLSSAVIFRATISRRPQSNALLNDFYILADQDVYIMVDARTELFLYAEYNVLGLLMSYAMTIIQDGSAQTFNLDNEFFPILMDCLEECRRNIHGQIEIADFLYDEAFFSLLAGCKKWFFSTWKY